MTSDCIQKGSKGRWIIEGKSGRNREKVEVLNKYATHGESMPFGAHDERKGKNKKKETKKRRDVTAWQRGYRTFDGKVMGKGAS